MDSQKIKYNQPRNNRFFYYLKGIARDVYPKKLLRLDMDKKILLTGLSEEVLMERVDYYNQLSKPFSCSHDAKLIKDIPIRKSGSMYYYDLMEYARFFPQNNLIDYLFGDIQFVPEFPSFVKSRPITENNKNSIIFKFCKVRNFKFYNDPIPFREKNNKVIWRGACHQKHRVAFMEEFFGKSPNIDIGQHNKGKGDGSRRNPQWQMPFMTIPEQLQNKFILSIEGNDVATNLKWTMASNSLCIMRKPRFEAWFMEGRLKADFHYVEVKDDYSDLEEKISYFIKNPKEAEEIIRNANAYADQFKNIQAEDWISLKIMQKYYKLLQR